MILIVNFESCVIRLIILTRKLLETVSGIVMHDRRGSKTGEEGGGVGGKNVKNEPAQGTHIFPECAWIRHEKYLDSIKGHRKALKMRIWQISLIWRCLSAFITVQNNNKFGFFKTGFSIFRPLEKLCLPPWKSLKRPWILFLNRFMCVDPACGERTTSPPFRPPTLSFQNPWPTPAWIPLYIYRHMFQGVWRLPWGHEGLSPVYLLSSRTIFGGSETTDARLLWRGLLDLRKVTCTC